MTMRKRLLLALISNYEELISINVKKYRNLSFYKNLQIQIVFSFFIDISMQDQGKSGQPSNRSPEKEHKQKHKKQHKNKHQRQHSHEDRSRHQNSRSRSRQDQRHERNSHKKYRDNREDRYNDRPNYNQRYDRQQNRQRFNKSYQKNSNNNYRSSKVKHTVSPCLVQAPKTFLLSDSSRFSGRFRVNITKDTKQPHRVEHSDLGELKNKITPIQKLWSSHIKQYLNISQFVQIYRPRKSLAYEPIEYENSHPNRQYDNSSEQPQIFSRAYFKLWEILETEVLKQFKNKNLSIGCVAEGPGGFIHALVDYRLRQQRREISRKKDCYNSITLKIDGNTRHAKDWSDTRGAALFDRLRNKLGQQINLSYGKTKTGDLLNIDNIEYFQSEVQNKCQLVTGDGGIECIGDREFEYQQVFNAKLFLGEIITAFHIQDVDGKFILKIYDCGFELTRQLIMLLALYYGTVKIVKPITSRPGNSEKYLVCEKFKGISEEELRELKNVLVAWTTIEPKLSYFQNTEFVHNLFDFSHIQNHQEIYKNIVEANDWFVNEQIQKIKQGLTLAQTHKESSRSIEQELKKTRFNEQISFAYSWCKKYGLPTIEVQELQ